MISPLNYQSSIAAGVLYSAPGQATATIAGDSSAMNYDFLTSYSEVNTGHSDNSQQTPWWPVIIGGLFAAIGIGGGILHARNKKPEIKTKTKTVIQKVESQPETIVQTATEQDDLSNMVTKAEFDDLKVGLESKIHSLESEMAQQQGNMSLLEGELAEIKELITGLGYTDNEIQGSIQLLAKKVAKLEEDLGIAQGLAEERLKDYNQVRAELATEQDSLAKAETALDQAQAALKDQTIAVQAMEKELQPWKVRAIEAEEELKTRKATLEKDREALAEAQNQLTRDREVLEQEKVHADQPLSHEEEKRLEELESQLRKKEEALAEKEAELRDERADFEREIGAAADWEQKLRDEEARARDLEDQVRALEQQVQEERAEVQRQLDALLERAGGQTANSVEI